MDANTTWRITGAGPGLPAVLDLGARTVTLQRLAAVAVIAVGAALFASALQGITRTDTRLAAAPAHTTPDRTLVEPTSYDCPQLDARGEVEPGRA